MNVPDFEKILLKRASAEEKEKFFRAVSDDKELNAEYIRYKNLWAIHSMDSDSVPASRRKQLFIEFRKKIGTGTTRKKLFVGLLKYAAVVLITAGVISLLPDYTGMTTPPPVVKEYSTTTGSIARILLSDDSEIWLNAKSKLKISDNRDEGIIATLDGEAYFDIRHDESRNFIVDLGTIRIKDQGTRFNVKAFAEEGQITATLINGKIDIQNDNQKKPVSLVPGEHFIFNKLTNRFSLDSVDPSLVTGWKDGKFVFLERNLREICDELEQWYDVKILIKSKQDEKEIYSSVMKRSTTIKQVLELLKLTTGMQYRIEEKEGGTDIVYLY
ncbi:MAG: FecR family protein [Prolixibacteraceae bacterium]